MKKSISIIIKLVVGAVFGFVCGYIGASSFKDKDSSIEEILILGGVIICLIFGTVLHMVIHELGHLLFGKLSGYDFVSFRIANII